MSKKFICVLVLFMGLAVFSFGETFFGVAGGYYRLEDTFFSENFGRSLNGSSGVFSFYYFANDFPLGFTMQFSFGSFFSGFEWKDNEKPESIGYNTSVSNIRLAIAPAYKLQLGPQVRIPFTLGPVFSLYSEDGDFSYWDADGEKWIDHTTYYEAFDFGLLGSAVLIVNPFSRFHYIYLQSGFGVEWDFLRMERGEMYLEYRKHRTAQYSNVRYMSFGFNFFAGIGLRLN